MRPSSAHRVYMLPVAGQASAGNAQPGRRELWLAPTPLDSTRDRTPDVEWIQ